MKRNVIDKTKLELPKGVRHKFEQYYGKDRKMGNLFGLSSLKEGEHESMTRRGAEQANERLAKEGCSGYSDKDLQGLRVGARFNDLCGFDPAGFAINYKSGENPFVNQSHKGDMQFLHCMSLGDSYDNQILKQLRWMEFVWSVFQNKDNIVEKELHSYIMESNDELLQKMMLAMFLEPDKLKAIEREIKGQEERFEKIKVAVRERANCFYYYRTIKIKDFFKAEEVMDHPQAVALGSLLHMIEDSFAKSHVQRMVNTLGTGTGKVDFTSKDSILAVVPHIMLFENYKVQDANWHRMGDLFQRSDDLYDDDFINNRDRYNKALQNTFNKTEGAYLAVNVISYVLYYAKKNPDQALDLTRDLLKGIFRVDQRAELLQEIQQVKASKDEKRLKEILDSLKGTDLGLLDFNKNVILTDGGRQYQTGENAKKYDALLNAQERDNVRYTLEEKVDHYKKQVEALNEVAKTASSEEKVKIKSMVAEVFLHLCHIKDSGYAVEDSLIKGTAELFNQL